MHFTSKSIVITFKKEPNDLQTEIFFLNQKLLNKLFCIHLSFLIICQKMLKALNEEVCWLTNVRQVAWNPRKTPKDWQTNVIILHTRKAIAKSVRIIKKYHS